MSSYIGVFRFTSGALNLFICIILWLFVDTIGRPCLYSAALTRRVPTGRRADGGEALPSPGFARFLRMRLAVFWLVCTRLPNDAPGALLRF